MIERNICVWILSTTAVGNISYSENNWTKCDQKSIIIIIVTYLLQLSFHSVAVVLTLVQT